MSNTNTNAFAAFSHVDQSEINHIRYAAEQYACVADDLNNSVRSETRRKTLDDHAEEYADAYGDEYETASHDDIVAIYKIAYNAEI